MAAKNVSQSVVAGRFWMKTVAPAASGVGPTVDQRNAFGAQTMARSLNAARCRLAPRSGFSGGIVASRPAIDGSAHHGSSVPGAMISETVVSEIVDALHQQHHRRRGWTCSDMRGRLSDPTASRGAAVGHLRRLPCCDRRIRWAHRGGIGDRKLHAAGVSAPADEPAVPPVMLSPTASLVTSTAAATVTLNHVPGGGDR
jgi:hypothetical protein